MAKVCVANLYTEYKIYVIKFHPYKYILTNPGETEISINSPQGRKCDAEW